MPVASKFPSFELPTQDIFNFLFERKDREYPDDKGKILFLARHCRITQFGTMKEK